MKKPNPLTLYRRAYLYIVFIFLVCGNFCFAQVTISDVSSTISTCPNNGTISVTASNSSGGQLLYRITGPLTQPNQTSATFSSLPPGNYTVFASDGSGNSDSRSVLVPGNYATLELTTTTTAPSCPGGNNGRITGWVQNNTGLAPYTWEITKPAAFIRGPQASNTFEDLPAGDYEVRVNDACQATKTIPTKIIDKPGQISFVNGSPVVEKTGCNEAIIKMDVSVESYSPPYTIVINSNSAPVTPTKVDTLKDYLPYRIVLEATVSGVDYGDNVSIAITDNCNRIASAQGKVHDFKFCSQVSNELIECKYLQYTFSQSNTNCLPNGNLGTYLDAPVTYELKDAVTQEIVESGTITSGDPEWGTGIYDVPFRKVEHNKNYTVTIKDGCDNVFTETFESQTGSGNTGTPRADPAEISEADCIDSTAVVKIRAYDFSSKPQIIFLSGPSGAKSTKEGFDYPFIDYFFPDTVESNTSGQGYNEFNVANLAPGTYTYEIINDCGARVPGTLVIRPEDVISFKKEDNHFWYEPGCNGNNKINFYLTDGGRVNIFNNAINFDWSNHYFFLDGDTVRESIPNIAPGTYNAFLSRSTSGGVSLNDRTIFCHSPRETIVVEPYSSPIIMTYNSLLCGNSIIAELFPDSSKGVPPYEYEIISGPQTFPRQSSNIFTLNTKGIYRARIYDDCGSATTRDITIEEVEFKPMVADVTCSSTRIVYPSSIYYTYEWTRPDNSKFTGDSLIISSITPADTGTYKVVQKIDISGCTHTVNSSHHITTISSSSVEETVCPGVGFTLGAKTYFETGIYKDTVKNSLGCDSIVQLNLTVLEYKRHTVNETICPGGSIVIGNKTYSEKGTYYDTLTTTTCDSIVTINIQLGEYLTGNIEETICPGTSVSIAGKIYDKAGTFEDTLSTGTCDSILTIKINVWEYKRGTMEASYCRGSSVTIRGKTYNVPGLFRDTLTTNTCDSIVEITVTEVDFLTGTMQVSKCPKKPVTVLGEQYDAEGTFYKTLSTPTCDSIVTIIISESDYLRGNHNATKCPGQPITILGKTYTKPDIYLDTVPTLTCDSIVTITITDLPYLRGNYTANKCKGQSITIFDKVYTEEGIFDDTLSTSTCDSIVTITISDIDYFRRTIDKMICPGETVTIRGNAYNNEGTYEDQFPTSTCDSLLTINIHFAPIPPVELGKDTSLCLGDSIKIDAGNGNSKYRWNSEAVTSNRQSITVKSIGAYWVDVENSYGCQSSDTLKVLNIHPLPVVSASSDTTICHGEKATLKANGGVKYLWSPLKTAQSTVTVNPPSTTTYSVVAIDGNNCTSLQKKIKVSVIPKPIKPLFSNAFQTHCFLDTTLKLVPNWGVKFLWSPSGDTAMSISVNKEGVYSLKAIDEKGCPLTEEITVENKCDVVIEVPGAFSPNYDGANDELEIFGKNFSHFEMRIFNRWGEIIFLTTDPKVKWDGTYRSEIMPVGSYNYVILYDFISKDNPGITIRKRKTGSVTLIR